MLSIFPRSDTCPKQLTTTPESRKRSPVHLQDSQTIYQPGRPPSIVTQEELTVSQAMEKSVMIVELNTTAQECAKAMTKRGVSCAVITQLGRALGIVTERDLVSKVMAE